MAWFSKGKKESERLNEAVLDNSRSAAEKTGGEKTMGSPKIQLIKKEFEKAELKHQVQQLGPLDFLEAGFSGDNATVKIRVIAVDNDSEVKVMSDDFAKFPGAKLEAGYKLANQLNRKYKFVKFTIDNDGDLSAQWDLPDSVPSELVGKVAMEIVLRMFKIIDDAYPEVMKAVWA